MRLLALLLVCGCYTGAPAARDVDLAWTGRSSAEIRDRWGAPAHTTNTDLVWSFSRTHVGALPSGGAALKVSPTGIDAAIALSPGELVHVTTEAVATLDTTGAIARVDGASLHWGPPNDANLHWGTIFGAHGGLGILDAARTPLPSFSTYLGGMLTPDLGLVGTFSFVAGTSATGSALGLAAGMAAQWWPINRLWLRAGPALLLFDDPGFTDTRLRPGVTTGASYAFVKVGTLAIDLRLDAALGPSVAFGSVGFGINLN